MFVLGFYVTIVVTRWWDQFNLLPWPDSFAIMCVGMFKASRERVDFERDWIQIC